MSKKVSIVYFSATGHTHLMAEHVAKGVQTVAGTEVELVRVNGKDIIEGRYKNKETIDNLVKSDAIIFGSPTYMGNVAAQLKAFIDALSEHWFTQALKDKIAGGFTHSSSPYGDKGSTFAYLKVLADQLGMLWVGNGVHAHYLTGDEREVNRFSFSSGPAGQTFMGAEKPVLNDGDAITAELYGARIAKFTQKL
jgi:NAD(P)H dehydrogenase (quinone)